MLSGKAVLLLFATHACYGSGSFLPELRRMYCEKKEGTDDDFEIIYISLDCDESITSFSACIQEMPWLVHAFIPHFSYSLSKKVFQRPPVLPAIAAFRRDGYLDTKESNLAFKKEGWSSKYPFIQDNMDEEVRWELVDKHRWDLERLFFRTDYSPEISPESSTQSSPLSSD